MLAGSRKGRPGYVVVPVGGKEGGGGERELSGKQRVWERKGRRLREGLHHRC